MSRRLSIAHCVESYSPSVGGMQEVVKQLSERIVRMGHEVTVYTSRHPARTADEINGVRIRSFQMVGNVLTGYTGDKEGYLDALANGGHDVITLFAAQQFSADLVLEQAHRFKARMVFVPTGFSRLHSPSLKGYYEKMAYWMQQMDLNIFLSDRYQDIEFARKHGVERITIIPNGASEEEFMSAPVADIRAMHGIGKHQLMLVHVGSFTGLKGHEDAVRIFVEADIGDAVLALAGSDIDVFERKFKWSLKFLGLRWKAFRRKKRILFLKLDRPHTVAAMRQADLFFFPSRVECSPIVLFEAMAAGIPFLSSTAGNSEEIAEWSSGGWTIPGTQDEHGWWNVDRAAGVRMLNDLANDPTKLKKAGITGHKAWKERFTWQRIAEQYLQEYLRLAK